MMPEGSVAEYLSHMQNKKPATSHIFISTLFHKRKLNVLSNWYSTNNLMVTNNSINNNNNSYYNGKISLMVLQSSSLQQWIPVLHIILPVNYK